MNVTAKRREWDVRPGLSGRGMRAVAKLLVAALVSLQMPGMADALQSGTMRCRSGIVSLDDTVPDVLRKCGSPVYQDRREETSSFVQRHGRSFETVTVDTWIYNFGPQEFMYEVTFRNGRVTRIESLDPGY